MTRPYMTQADNGIFWAVGYVDHRRRFHIRRLLKGRLLARAERRKGEVVKKALVEVVAVNG